jgi:APA family basic amino acid/polyamine antiporter
MEDKLLNNNQLEKRYGLFTAICMVVGIVIGSGVFFKAQDILKYTGGNMLLGILAWVIGGIVMIICAFNFANFATKYSKVNGVVDYAEAAVGEKYGYMMGWFVSTVYYPAMTSVLAWVSARYTLVLFGIGGLTALSSGLCLALGAFYLILAYAVNVISPKIAGKFQVSATVVKLIPLAIMVIVGTIAGLVNGNTAEAFASAIQSSGTDFGSVFAGVAAAAFAYEGWIIATSVNAELKDSKRNLPIALVAGTILIMLIYILYFIGLTGGASVDVLINDGATTAFKNLFGNVGGTILSVFIVISCLGTLNGLMLACTRAPYSIAIRDHGPNPEMFASVDQKSNMPANSGVLGLLFCGFWFFYFYASNMVSLGAIQGEEAIAPIFGVFSFDSSELPIITIYGMYIPIFIMFIIKEGKKNIFKNMVMPVLGTISCLFMMFVAVYAHGVRPYQSAAANGEFSFPVLFYLIVYVVIMAIGLLLYKKRSK